MQNTDIIFAVMQEREKKGGETTTCIRKITGEPDDAKVSSPVRRGAVGKGRKRTSPAAYPTCADSRD